MKQDASPSHTPAPPDQLLAQLRAELAAAQQDKARLQQQLAAAQAELGDFSYSVSHDLRACLRHIHAYTGLIREDLGEGVTAGVASHLNIVSNAARQMGCQIDGLMALSQLGRSDLQVSGVDMRPLIAEVCSALAPELAGRQVAWQVADDFPLVRGDAALIRQLWGHLLSNAIKYTRARAAAQVRIGWKSGDARSCSFFVQDNGVGFNPQFKDRLFHVFQRLHSANEFEGVGMGLALARKIVERHGGEVRAQGEVGAGCSISFTLPLFPGDAAKAAWRQTCCA